MIFLHLAFVVAAVDFDTKLECTILCGSSCTAADGDCSNAERMLTSSFM